MAPVVSHFHCPDCYPQLQRGVTRGICGQIISKGTEGTGWAPECPACKKALRQHQANHR